MKRAFIPQVNTSLKSIEIPTDEAHHLVQVMRLNAGDSIEILNGTGGRFAAKLERKGKLWIADQIIESPYGTDDIQSYYPIKLEMALIKGDAMNWVIEKAVELGCHEFQPVLTRYSVVRIKTADSTEVERYTNKWQKTADQALKQCGRRNLMKILPIKSLEDLLSEPTKNFRLWFDEKMNPRTSNLISILNKFNPTSVSIITGPEGGFSPEEINLLQNEITSCSLGPLVLRAETAALTSLSTCSQWFRNSGS